MINNFKNYLRSKIINNKVDKEYLVEGLSQFDKPIYQVLNIPVQRCSELMKRAFRKELKNKPRNVPVNIWFLIQFGYKKCYKCNNILQLDKFHNRKDRWHNKNDNCLDCEKNRDRIEYYTEYNQNHKEKRRKYARQYQKDNPDKFNANNAKRRANKLQATPNCITKQQLIEIEDIYWQAKETGRILGEPFHVDHIHPLSKGGLHVPWNLQILTATENLKKSNKLEVI